MVRSIEISRVADGTAKFDRLERVGIIERDEFGDKVGTLGFQPKMELQIAGVEGAAGVHKTNERWVESWVAA